MSQVRANALYMLHAEYIHESNKISRKSDITITIIF